MEVSQLDMSDAKQFQDKVETKLKDAMTSTMVAPSSAGTIGTTAPGPPAPATKMGGTIILIRDALQHIPNDLVVSTLKNLRHLAGALGDDFAKKTTLMLGHYKSAPGFENAKDIGIGGYRSINLREPPFAQYFSEKSGDEVSAIGTDVVGYLGESRSLGIFTVFSFTVSQRSSNII